ncbi:hypothetical protein [Streptomyces sp. AC495_CC817]|uniref:hypothetical protein n=1 Tax=Streptomyces sp. AC495_CC817 TaxID=2823900 RepID=UPI001C280E7E|nr:hypothetical protein [Streptomyces sp. AC495_CC817]
MTLNIPETMRRKKRTNAVRDWLDIEVKRRVRDVDYAVAVLEQDEEGARGDAAVLVALGALAIALATFSASSAIAVVAFYCVTLVALIGLLIGQLDGMGRETALRRLYRVRRDLIAEDDSSPAAVAPIQIAKAWGIFHRR